MFFNDSLPNTHRPDTLAIVAVVVARVDITGIEVQAVPAEGIARIERTRPTVAAAASIGERRINAIARSRQENAIAVALTYYLTAIYTILCGPCCCCITCVD